MSKRHAYLGVLLISFGVLAVALTFILTPSKEPRYGGKRLSEWFLGYRNSEQVRQTDEAIRHIGTNAIPYLMEWIRYEPRLQK